MPQRPKKLVVCGGGRHNPAMMAMLPVRAGVEAVPAETVGWRGDAIEAECFAFLAVRVLRGLPISFPTTTGAPHPLTGGRVAGLGAPCRRRPLTPTLSPRGRGGEAAQSGPPLPAGDFEAAEGKIMPWHDFRREGHAGSPRPARPG